MKKLISVAILAACCAAPVAAAPTTLTLKASPTLAAYGGSTTLSGVLSTLNFAPAPATNGVGDLAKMLAYARGHGGPGDLTVVNG